MEPTMDPADTHAVSEELPTRQNRPADTAIIAIDRDGLITEFDRTLEKQFQRSRDGVIGRNIAMLMPSPYKENHVKFIQNYFRTGKSTILAQRRTLPAQRKDGSTFSLDMLVQPDQDATGCITGFFAIVYPQTKHKKREEDDDMDDETLADSGFLIETTQDIVREQQELAAVDVSNNNLQKLKSGTFNVLLVVLKEMQPAPLWLTMLKWAIDFLQFGAFLFKGDANFPWHPDYVGFLERMTSVLLFLPLGTSLGFWIAGFSVVCLVLLNAMFVGYSVVTNTLRQTWTVQTLRSVGSFFAETLYMPVVVLFSVRIREANESPALAVAAALSAVVGIMFMIFALLITGLDSSANPRAAASVPGQSHSRIKLFMLSARTVLAVMFGLAADSISRWILVLVLVFVYNSALALHLLYQPFFQPFFTHVRVGMFGVLAWGSLCLLLACIQDDSTDSGPITAFFMGGPLAAGISVLLCYVRRTQIAARSVERLSNVLEVDLKARGMLSLLDDHSHGALNHGLRPMEEEEIIAAVMKVYEEASARWPGVALLNIFRSSFFLHYVRSKHIVLRELREGYRKATMLDEEFTVFKLQRTVDSFFGNGESVVQYLLNKQLLVDAKQSDRLASVAQLQFWTELLKEQPQVSELHAHAASLNKHIAQGQNAFERLIEQGSSQVSSGLLRMYGSFLAGLMNDETRAAQYINRADLSEDVAAKSLATVGHDGHDMFGEGMPVVEIIGEGHRTGAVTQVYSAITALLGYQDMDLSGRSVADMLAPPFGDWLLLLLEQHNETGEDKLLQKKFTLGLHRDGTLMPLNMYAKDIAEDRTQLRYAVAFQLAQCESHFILLASDQSIEAQSPGLNSVFGKPLPSAQSGIAFGSVVSDWPKLRTQLATNLDKVQADIITVHGENVRLTIALDPVTTYVEHMLEKSHADMTQKQRQDGVHAISLRSAEVEMDWHLLSSGSVRQSQSIAALNDLSKTTVLRIWVEPLEQPQITGNPSRRSLHATLYACRSQDSLAKAQNRPYDEISVEHGESVASSYDNDDTTGGRAESNGEKSEQNNAEAKHFTRLQHHMSAKRLQMLDSDRPTANSDRGRVSFQTTPNIISSERRPVLVSKTISKTSSNTNSSVLLPGVPEMQNPNSDSDEEVEAKSEEKAEEEAEDTATSKQTLGGSESARGSRVKLTSHSLALHEQGRLDAVPANLVEDEAEEHHGKAPSQKWAKTKTAAKYAVPSVVGNWTVEIVTPTSRHRKLNARHVSSPSNTNGNQESPRSQKSGANSLRSGASSATESTRIARKMKSISAESLQDLRRFSRMMTWSLVVVALIGIVNFVTAEVLVAQFKARSQIISDSGDRIFLATRAATDVHNLVLLSENVDVHQKPVAEVRSNIKAALDMLGRKDQELHASIDDESAAMYALWNTPITEFREADGTVMLLTMWSAVREFLSRAYRVAEADLSSVNGALSDVYFVLSSALGPLNDAYEFSTFAYISATEKQLETLELTSLTLSLVSIFICLMALIFVVVPALNRVQARQLRSLSIFLAMPKSAVKELWLNARIRVKRSGNQNDDDTIEGIARGIELEKEKERVRLNTKKNVARKEGKYDIPESLARNKSYFARVSALYGVACLFFLLAFFLGIHRMNAPIRAAPAAIASSAVRRGVLDRSYLGLQLFATEGAVPKAPGLPDPNVTVVNDLKTLSQLTNALIYGDASLNVKRWKERGLSSHYEYVMFNDGCQDTVSIPNQQPDLAACRNFSNDLFGFGLYPALREYARRSEALRASINALRANSQGSNVTHVNAFVQDPAYQWVLDFSYTMCQSGLQKTNNLQNQAVQDMLADVTLGDTLMLSGFLVALAVLYVALFVPVVTIMQQQTLQTRQILEFVPVDVLKEVDAYKRMDCE